MSIVKIIIALGCGHFGVTIKYGEMSNPFAKTKSTMKKFVVYFLVAKLPYSSKHEHLFLKIAIKKVLWKFFVFVKGFSTLLIIIVYFVKIKHLEQTMCIAIIFFWVFVKATM